MGKAWHRHYSRLKTVRPQRNSLAFNGTVSPPEQCLEVDPRLAHQRSPSFFTLRLDITEYAMPSAPVLSAESAFLSSYLPWLLRASASCLVPIAFSPA
jgi:hypothetical protein